MMTNKKTDSNDLSSNTVLEKWTKPMISDGGVYDSYPLDISLANIKSICLPPLKWLDFEETPSDMTIQNTGFTLDVQTEFTGQRPTLTGSILEYPYEFRSYRFHWGAKGDEGSELHTWGKRFPMEIHLAFHRVNNDLHMNKALDHNNDMIIMVYTCKLEPDENVVLEDLISNLKHISKPGDSVKIKPFSWSNLFDRKIEKYLMYWSDSDDNEYKKPILWMICPKQVSINTSQLFKISLLESHNDKDILPNARQSRTSSPHQFILYDVTSQADCAVEYFLRDLEGNFRLSVLDNLDDRPEEQRQQTMIMPFRERDNILGYEKSTTLAIDTVSSYGSENTIRESDEQVKMVSEFLEDETTPQLSSTFTTPSSSITNEKIIDEDSLPAKDIRSVIRSIDSLLNELSVSAKTEYSAASANQTVVENTRKETSKETVLRSIDNLLNELNVSDKTECPAASSNRILVERTRREGVRMNSTALKREIHIKNKLQELNAHKK